MWEKRFKFYCPPIKKQVNLNYNLNFKKASWDVSFRTAILQMHSQFSWKLAANVAIFGFSNPKWCFLSWRDCCSVMLHLSVCVSAVVTFFRCSSIRCSSVLNPLLDLPAVHTLCFSKWLETNKLFPWKQTFSSSCLSENQLWHIQTHGKS